LYYLVQKVKEFGFQFIDSQVETDHLISLGAELISRSEYLKQLKKAILTTPSKTGKW
jgi:leucyl/phenylalanyl-tRNA--protein transferase